MTKKKKTVKAYAVVFKKYFDEVWSTHDTRTEAVRAKEEAMIMSPYLKVVPCTITYEV